MESQRTAKRAHQHRMGDSTMSLDALFPKASAAIDKAMSHNAAKYGRGLTYLPHQEELAKCVGHIEASLRNNDNAQDGTTHTVSALIRLLKVCELEL